VQCAGQDRIKHPVQLGILMILCGILDYMHMGCLRHAHIKTLPEQFLYFDGVKFLMWGRMQVICKNILHHFSGNDHF
jgi:hypothetical protein